MRWLLTLAALLTGGCDAVLGLDERERPVPDAGTLFGAIEPLLLTCPTGQTASDPTVADDANLFAYSCSALGGTDLHEADRLSPTLGGPTRVILSTAGTEGSPELSPDGLSLYFLTFSGASVGNISLLERTSLSASWGVPQVPTGLNTAGDDRPGSPDASGKYLVISRAGVLVEYQRTSETMFVELATTTTLVAGPKAINPHVSSDGLTLVFAAPEGSADLYISHRAAVGIPWDQAVSITELNTAQNEADPWISADQRTIYFARQGVLLYAHK